MNCAAIPATLFESELFGHEAGSFTGAARSRVGLFEMAAEGTVFLDEVGELPMELQPKLLRALETREFRRVGGSKNIPLRARVVSATNRGLHGQADSTLRPDLHFRLAGFTITMPALRERPGDIELLARHFAAAFAERHGVTLNVGEDALTLFRQHDWPGNVRELKATVEHGAILSENGRIGSDVLRHAEPRGLEAVGASVRPAAPSAPSSASEAGEKRTQSGLRAIERDLILAAWKESGHNLSLAARILGIPRNTLRDKLRRLSAA